MINVAILDDHKMVVKSLIKLIDDSGIAKVTRIYYDIKSCRTGLKKPLPNVLLLDIGLPDGNGVDYCAELKKTFPKLKIIILTSYKEFNVAKRALHNGALGYVLKNSEPEEIIAGIEAVNAGERFLCEEIDVLLKEKVHEEVAWFSPREKEVLQYIADGCTTKEIADKIFRNEETVRSFRRVLLIKFDAGNTARMIKKACDQNLIR
jgi:DNA-binding NarL/FixJ family response regulator